MRLIFALILLPLYSHVSFAQNLPDSLRFTNKAEAKNQMVNGKKEGKWCEYVTDSQNDVVTDSTNAVFYRLTIYKADIPCGVQRLYYKTGALALVKPYIKGKINGIIKVYHEGGELEDELTYMNGEKNGVAKWYYKNGKLWFELMYKNDKKNGTEKDYYEDAALQWEKTYVNDTLNGWTKEYKDGKICRESHYVNGLIDGVEKVYYQSGKLWRELPYVKGKITGTEKWYYENGKLKSEIPRTAGQIDGTEREYYNTGKPESETVYTNDIKGIAKHFDENGKEIK